MAHLGVRINARNNLTVELIHQQRFDVAYARLARHDCEPMHAPTPARTEYVPCQYADRVCLSPEALAHEPWQDTPTRCEPMTAAVPSPIDPAHAPAPEPPEPEPRHITPIIGSPALSGLGVALIVPGTLLDVVA